MEVATSAALTPSVTIPKQDSGGRVGPIEPKQAADDSRAKEDRDVSEERVRDQAEKSDAGPGVGVKIDITA
ncbi:MAG: hypothetical protein RIM84_08555 [Alphaproteobacteria bacterium]